MSKVQFVGTYEGRSKNVGTVRCINFFPAIVENGQVVVLYGTPGLTNFCTIGALPIRGMLTVDDVLYVVMGSSVYSVSKTGVATYLDTGILSATGFVCMTTNGVEILITDRVNGYILTIATHTLTTVPAGGFPVPGSCTFLNGRLIVNEVGTRAVYASDLYDATTWDGLMFGIAEASNGLTVRVYATFASLFVLGEKSCEVWYDAGIENFPFVPNTSMTINTGCLAPYSVASSGSTGNSILWLAATDQGSGFVVRSDGGVPETVSTPEIEYLWSQYPRLDDAIAYGYREEGHSFYVINFVEADKTWVYDLQVNAWHERSSGTEGGRHLSDCYAYYNNQHIVSDNQSTGTLYVLDKNAYDDAGTPIVRTLIMPHQGNDTEKTCYISSTLIMESGVGTDGSEVMMLSMSDDDGHTYGNQHDASVGAAGEYKTRVSWNRLGAAFSRTFKVTTSAACKFAIRYAAIFTS